MNNARLTSHMVAAFNETTGQFYEREPRELFLGIDPGLSGGLAILDPDGRIVDLTAMPETERDICDYFREFSPRISWAVIEHVTPMAKQGLGSTWKFGKHYGFLRGLLIALSIRFEEIRPQVWQGALQIPKRAGKSPSAHKNVLKSRSQQIWPEQKWTLAICDAALIAEYARRNHQ